MIEDRKIVIVVCDGLADLPIAELKMRTPLERAKKYHLDRLMNNGEFGMVNNTPKGMPIASDISMLSILGYNPLECYPGRGAIEAVGQGLNIPFGSSVFRCNFITSDPKTNQIVEPTAGRISSKESKELIDYLNLHLGSNYANFHHGRSYRNLFIINEEFEQLNLVTPHDLIGHKIEDHLPENKGGKIIEYINNSKELLKNHEINLKRRDKGLHEANMIWFWGQGNYFELPSITKMHNLNGAVISAVDAVRGVAKAVGMDVLDVPGITGYVDTDYQAKVNYATEALHRYDLVYLHLQATDEISHEGDYVNKIHTIEKIDSKVIKPLIDRIEQLGISYKLVFLPDHITSCTTKMHEEGPVPFVIFDGKYRNRNNLYEYNETVCRDKGKYNIEVGSDLFNEYILKNNDVTRIEVT